MSPGEHDRIPVYELYGVSKTYNLGTSQVHAVRDLDLSIDAGDAVAVVGPSGSGKTTLLQLLGGLDRPSTGTVRLDGAAVTEPGADRGMVFQSYTLFPWLTVEQNIAFGLRERGMPPDARAAIARRYIEQVGLVGFERHWPRQLSGGMQQRTAIARALANDPKILLECCEELGEPMRGLDIAQLTEKELMQTRGW